MARAGRHEEAVTPVLGTVFVLGITALTIGLVLLTGNPVLDRVRDRASISTMAPAIANVREATLQLAQNDAGRIVPVPVSGGDLQLVTGGRLLVTANASTACEMRVGGWTDSGTGGSVSTSTVTLSGGGCAANSLCYEQYDGASVTTVASLTAAPVITSRASTWHFVQLLSATCSTFGDGDIDAEAWLVSTDRLEWASSGSGLNAKVALEGGAIFSRSTSTNIEKLPDLDESRPGTDMYLRIPALHVAGGIASAPEGNRQVELLLSSLQPRIDLLVSSVRLDVSGTYASAWCSALLLQNSFFTSTDLTYGDFPYTQTTGTTRAPPCTTEPTGIYSVIFRHVGNNQFNLRFLHAEIDATLAL